MDPEESYNLNDNLFPWYFGNDLVYIKMIQSKPPLIAVLASGQYGLVSCILEQRKYRCIWPHKNSRVCGHVQMYENGEIKKLPSEGHESKHRKVDCPKWYHLHML